MCVCPPRPQDQDPARTQDPTVQTPAETPQCSPPPGQYLSRDTHSPRKPNQTTTTLPNGIGQSASATPRRVELRAATPSTLYCSSYGRRRHDRGLSLGVTSVHARRQLLGVLVRVRIRVRARVGVGVGVRVRVRVRVRVSAVWRPPASSTGSEARRTCTCQWFGFGLGSELGLGQGQG